MNLPTIATLSETRPLARTSHTCSVCGQPIAIGQKYSRILLRDEDALDRKKSLRVVKWHLPFCPSVSQ